MNTSNRREKSRSKSMKKMIPVHVTTQTKHVGCMLVISFQSYFTILWYDDFHKEKIPFD